MKRFNLVSLLVICLAATAAHGAVAAGGNLRPFFACTTGPESLAGVSRFDIDQAEFDVKGDITPRIGVRFTTDCDRPLSGAPVIILKHAFLQVSPCDCLTFKLGEADMPWNHFEEDVWGFRFIQKVMPDIAGLTPGQDFGLLGQYSLPRGFGELEAALANGEGKGMEINKYKEGHVRLTLTPFTTMDALKGLELSGLFSTGAVDSSLKRSRALVNLGYAYKFLSLGGTYVLAASDDAYGDGETLQVVNTKHGGMSVYGSLDIGNLIGKGRWGVLGRFDSFDPNTSLTLDKWSTMTAGLFCALTDGVQVAADIQSKSYEDTARKPDGTFYFHTEVKFKI